MEFVDQYICVNNQLVPIGVEDENIADIVNQCNEFVTINLSKIVKFYIARRLPDVIIVTLLCKDEGGYYVVVKDRQRDQINVRVQQKPLCISTCINIDGIVVLVLLDGGDIVTIICGLLQQNVSTNRHNKKNITSLSPISWSELGPGGARITHTCCVCDGLEASLSTRGTRTDFVAGDTLQNITRISESGPLSSTIGDRLCIKAPVRGERVYEKIYIESIPNILKCDPLGAIFNNQEVRADYIVLTTEGNLITISISEQERVIKTIAEDVLNYCIINSSFDQYNNLVFIKKDGNIERLVGDTTSGPLTTVDPFITLLDGETLPISVTTTKSARN